jgi:hypothetical protein
MGTKDGPGHFPSPPKKNLGVKKKKKKKITGQWPCPKKIYILIPLHQIF